MLADAQTATYGPELLNTAAAAAERAPQLADEIRFRSRHLAQRFSGGGHLHPSDVDVRSLVGLIEQSGVSLPLVSVRQT